MTTVATGLEDAVDDLQPRIATDIARIRSHLESYAQGEPPRDHEEPITDPAGPLHDIARIFNLSSFERDLLMLCAAVELDGDVAAEISRSLGTADPRPTLGLALSCLPGAHWDALVPEAPLRSWRLIDLSGGDTLTGRRASIDERILQYLMGLAGLDRRLDGTVISLPGQPSLFPSHDQAAADLAETLLGRSDPTLVNLNGSDDSTALAIAIRAGQLVGAVPIGILGEALPGPGPALYDITRLIDREWILERRVPVITGTDGNPQSVSGFVKESLAPLQFTINASIEPLGGSQTRLLLHIPIELPKPEERRQLLQVAVGAAGNEELDSVIEDVSHRHQLSSAAITAIGTEMSRQLARGAEPEQLANLSREQSRTRLDHLAHRISSNASWEDIVLPQGHIDLLHEITRQVKHRTTVYDKWGFADRSTRGLGVTALFAGESGTGKTLAAEIIANELSLDLYRVDLAATVSKYIGETEKNLARLFDAAESSGAVLLFDEADALFGKRTEVRDSHDRYANLEVAYLLQRMESYRGLAILTTNLRSNLDRAFVRRLRFIIQFPFPDEAQRAEIWRRTFPPRTPLNGVEPAALARLTIPGGSIWSIALAAAFSAADDGTAVTSEHLLQAARIEYAKTDRALTPTETAALQ